MAIYTIDACAGTGMLGLGVHCALGFDRVRTVCYVEQESRAAANLVARMEDKTLDQAPVWDDVKGMCDPQFLDYIQQFRPLILCAGYPCQPFSEAGKRRGTEDERHIWPHLFRFVEEAQPECVFFENVAGHVRLGLGAVLGDLEGAGYSVATGLFTASEVGASHRRQRLFILGYSSAVQRGVPGCGSVGKERREESVQPESLHAGNSMAGTTGPVEYSNSLRCDPERPGEVDMFSGCAQEEMEHTASKQGERRGLPEQSEARATDGAPGGSNDLADACSPGLQGHIQDPCTKGREAPRRPASGCGGLLFAPGPAEYGAWARTIESHPSLKPSLCRVADGVDSGTNADRLRLIGNGVVPLQAAYAFVSLAAVLE